jgi:hypothetical protein
MKISPVAVAIAVLAAGPATARVHHLAARHHHVSRLPFGFATQPQIDPQFNDPGPQLYLPQGGNPVEQLAPLQSTNPSFWSR